MRIVKEFWGLPRAITAGILVVVYKLRHWEQLTNMQIGSQSPVIVCQTSRKLA